MLPREMTYGSSASGVARFFQYTGICGCLLVLLGVLVSSASAQQNTPPTKSNDYRITIHLKGGSPGSKPSSYSADKRQGNIWVPVPMRNNTDLAVNGLDSVEWVVDNDDGKYGATIAFLKTPTTPLMDKNNKPSTSVSGTEADSIWGRISSTASGEYAYSVKVDDAKGSHTDDPKIIVNR